MHQQRRDNKVIRLSLIILSVLLLSQSESLIKVPVVEANLIGIDFGSTFIKATLVRPGKKFEIVENTASMRKT
jgi:activator of 2-hydroxyglutaryl-CoA dehydratase